MTAIAVFMPTQVSAQTSRAAATITPDAVARHFRVMAADSMLGRDTPSPGLETAARYVASQFAQIGLKPGGHQGSWFQRYATIVATNNRISFHNPKQLAAPFVIADGGQTRLIGSVMPDRRERATAVLVAGRHTKQSLPPASFDGKIVLYVAPRDLDSTVRQQMIGHLVASTTRGVVVLSDGGTPGSKKLLPAKDRQLVSLPRSDSSFTWAIEVAEGVRGLENLLVTAAGLDLRALRADSTPVIRPLPSLMIEFLPDFQRELVDSSPTAPNVVGILEGSDPNLKSQFIVISAHLDDLGGRRTYADSTATRAHDNASGIAGLIALANAFSHPSARPRRSLIFLATSGAMKGLWGSNYAARLIEPAANITLDMLGRDAGDTIVIDGLSEVELATPLAWIVTQQAELGLAVKEGGSVFEPQSDHFAFVQRGVPSLYFHNGSHQEVRETGDGSMPVGSERATRIFRLVYHLSQAMADAEQVPKWSLAARQRFLKLTASRWGNR